MSSSSQVIIIPPFPLHQAEGVSDKHKLLFTQRKAEFLQDFGENVSALEEAEKEVEYIIKLTIILNNSGQVEKMLKKMPGLDKSKEDSRSITTIQGRGGKEKTPNSNGSGATSYPPTTNSAQYGASQNAAWQQHGSRCLKVFFLLKPLATCSF